MCNRPLLHCTSLSIYTKQSVSWSVGINEEWVVTRLLQLGAEVNSRPTYESQTALQEVCAYGAMSSKVMDRQERVIRLLVAHGADVNAASGNLKWRSTPLQLIAGWYEPSHATQAKAIHSRRQFLHLIAHGARLNAGSGLFSCIAMQLCASHGDIEKAMLLVQHRAGRNDHLACDESSDFEAPVWRSALDLAARNGRMDMTQYLLNIGALSVSPGTTGYQGQ